MVSNIRWTKPNTFHHFKYDELYLNNVINVIIR